MRISNDAQFPIVPTEGTPPEIFWGTIVPDTGNKFAGKKIGTHYLYQHSLGYRMYTKVKNGGISSDWICNSLQAVSERFSIGDFADGGGTVGTHNLDIRIPSRAWVMQALLSDVTGFTGNVSCTIQIGDGTDVDRYSTGTPSVFTTATAIDVGVPSGTKIHTAQVTPRITLTSNSDFTAVSAGAATVVFFFLMV